MTTPLSAGSGLVILRNGSENKISHNIFAYLRDFFGAIRDKKQDLRETNPPPIILFPVSPANTKGLNSYASGPAATGFYGIIFAYQ